MTSFQANLAPSSAPPTAPSAVRDIQTARVFAPLLAPARYKGAHGGRGSGKSHFFAGLLVEAAMLRPGLRAVCIREVQKTLKSSAKKLIEDLIQLHGLGPAFDVLDAEIRTPGGGLILFQGMQDHNAESIKSLEGVDIAWCEEAQSLSARSLSLLRPTIRREGSELWFSWNRTRKNDPVDQFLTGFINSDGAHIPPPDNAIVVRSNWSDNPWFPAVLEAERASDKHARPDQYGHTWEGEYQLVAAGAYYASALTDARSQGRVGRVAADPLMQRRAYWDLGVTDSTAIWVAQFIDREIRVIDYYEASGQPLASHLSWLRRSGHGDALCYLPHDGADHDAVLAIRYEDHIRQAGFRVETIRNMGKGAAMKRIDTSRRVFPNIWFNEATTRAGLDALGAYHERRDEHRNTGLGPEHDWCLASGTQILTPAGWRNVEDIAVHDLVLTPCGTRRILRSGIVRRTSEWASVKGIGCTPEHRFFTSRGLVEAGALSPQERFWTRGALGLTILAFLSVIFRSGFKAAIISATPGVRRRVPAAIRSSFIAWCMRLCMAQCRAALRFIISTKTRSTIIRETSSRSFALSTAATTNQNRGTFAFAASVGRSSAVTRSSVLGAAQNADGPTTHLKSEPDDGVALAPAYNLTVDRDECYYARGDDGRAYLVSNSSHGCLTAEALVETSAGQVAIASVRVGDEVWTPRGWSRVTAAGPVKAASELIKVATVGGRTLTGTPEHKVLSQRGFVSLDALRHTDRIFSGSEWQCRLISWCSKVANTGFRETITGDTSGAHRGRATFTERFGRLQTGRLLKGWRSITRTAIPSIMASRTLKFSLSPSTNECTLLSGSLAENYSLQAGWPGKKPQNGMHRRLGWLGIQGTVRRLGKSGLGQNAFVRSVVSGFCRLILRAPNTATRIASKTQAGSEAATQLVFDLTVENHACYRANGLLVSNSDAFGLMCVAYEDPARLKANARKIQYPKQGYA